MGCFMCKLDYPEGENVQIDIFELPGYTLNLYKTDEQLTYAILPPAEKNPYTQDIQ